MFAQDSQDIAIFQGFTAHQLELLDTAFEACFLLRDMHVFEQGQIADYLYILTSGKVIIRYKPYDGPPLTVATIGPGGVFGWSVALGRSAYSSGALAVEDSQCYRISKARLSELCEDYPDTSGVLLKRLASLVNHETNPTYTEILKILKTGIKPDELGDQRSLKNGRRNPQI
jgi:CRP-like cAMP-binding protein